MKNNYVKIEKEYFKSDDIVNWWNPEGDSASFSEYLPSTTKLKNMKKIYFVQYEAGIRVYLQAKALKSTGKYNLVLICEKCNYELMKEVFDDIIFYGFIKNKDNNFTSRSLNFSLNKMFNYGKENLKNIIRNSDADIFHAHAEPNDIPRIVIENSKVPVIFDGQDFTGVSSGIENLDVKTREDEKYCFENADGICHKGPELEINYYRQKGYNIKCPELRWMGYCDENLCVDINFKRLSILDNEIHLVYAGSISPDKRYEYKYFIPLIKEITKQNIHFDIYTSSQSEYDGAKEYKELSQKNKYFNFHPYITYENLSRRLSKYDYGVLFEMDIRGDRYVEEKAKVGMASKLFSYMEAGIPIIVSEHLLPIKDFVEENKIGFSIKNTDIKNIGVIIKSYDYENFKKNISKAREIWSMKNQVKHLEDFYQKLQ